MLWLAPAWAGELENWEKLHRIQLQESADGDLLQAIESYKLLSQELDARDPLLPETFYWLGKARFAARDLEGASAALNACAARVSRWRQRCNDLNEDVALDASAVRKVPMRWDFSGDHGVLHPNRYAAEDRSFKIDRSGGDPQLAWTTTVDPRLDDLVIVGFDHPTPTPKGCRLVLRSSAFAARIRIAVWDEYGRRYQVAQVHVPVGRDVPVDVRFEAVDASAANAPTFDPATIDRLIIQDVTAYYTDAHGLNTIYLDDFEVY
jgi:hypothetical protein